MTTSLQVHSCRVLRRTFVSSPLGWHNQRIDCNAITSIYNEDILTADELLCDPSRSPFVVYPSRVFLRETLLLRMRCLTINPESCMDVFKARLSVPHHLGSVRGIPDESRQQRVWLKELDAI